MLRPSHVSVAKNVTYDLKNKTVRVCHVLGEVLYFRNVEHVQTYIAAYYKITFNALRYFRSDDHETPCGPGSISGALVASSGSNGSRKTLAARTLKLAMAA